MITREEIKVDVVPLSDEGVTGVDVVGGLHLRSCVRVADSAQVHAGLGPARATAEYLIWEHVYGGVQAALRKIRQDVANLQPALSSSTCRALYGKVLTQLDHLSDQLAWPPNEAGDE